MFVPVSVKVNGSTAYDRGFNLVGDRLTAFGKAAGDMTVPLAQVGDNLIMQVGITLAAQGSGAWAPLSDPYGPWKESHVPGVPILVGLRPTRKGSRESPTRPQSYTISGRMQRSLLDPVSVHVTPKRMTYTPTSDYAGYLQDGTERMPARPPVMLTPATLRSWDRAFVTWLNGLVKESGLDA